MFLRGGAFTFALLDALALLRSVDRLTFLPVVTTSAFALRALAFLALSFFEVATGAGLPFSCAVARLPLLGATVITFLSLLKAAPLASLSLVERVVTAFVLDRPFALTLVASHS